MTSEIRHELPSPERQELMWRIAVSSAMETAEPVHQIFARLIHNNLVGIGEEEDAEYGTK